MGFFDLLTGRGMDAYAEEGKQKGATFVDVREPGEYRGGHIEGAINIPVGSIVTAGKKLKDKDALLYVYCLSGARSSRAVAQLKSLGYTNVVNIGGIGSYHGPLAH